ncbi:MAG: hypothetical protein NUW21_14100, partial [Elusimicrobia bacterium]|nr:hypothetical protein [Elusimicrobiota bacterium]
MILLVSPAAALVPGNLTVQGRVDTPNAVLSGNASVLVNGNPTNFNAVPFSTPADNDGVFNLTLVGMSSTTFAADGTYILRLVIGASTLDIPLNTASFSFRAGTADDLKPGTNIQVGALSAADATISGNIIGGGSVTASAFFGDGTGLTGITSSADSTQNAEIAALSASTVSLQGQADSANAALATLDSSTSSLRVD